VAQGFRLVLASGSPRRRELLAQAGYAFEVQAADVDESLRAGERPDAYVRRLAEEKARAVLERVMSPTHRDEAAMNGAREIGGSMEEGPLVLPTHRDEAAMNGAREIGGSMEEGRPVVLGADTTVVCDGEILAKPEDAADAMRMLRMLSGRTHEVLTGVAVATRAGVVSAVESTSVTFSAIPQAELERYCATQEPMDKAGAYGIQGYAARWIPRIDGDYFNVMGLPIARVVGMIMEAVQV
jgi:septum formation protein